MIGAAAAAANLLFEFSIPAKKEDILTKNRKGKVIFVNFTARSNFCKKFFNVQSFCPLYTNSLFSFQTKYCFLLKLFYCYSSFALIFELKYSVDIVLILY